MNLVFATHNPGKLSEVQALMPESVTLLSLADLSCTSEIPETADTLQGNARLKASFIYREYGRDCFADDTGLIVPYLGGAPGVHSARYASGERNDQANMNKLLQQLGDTTQREAYFETCICLCLGGQYHFFTGTAMGSIAFKKSGKKGFGYDPIFIPQGYNRTFADLDASKKNKISHRASALKQLVNYLAALAA